MKGVWDVVWTERNLHKVFAILFESLPNITGLHLRLPFHVNRDIILSIKHHLGKLRYLSSPDPHISTFPREQDCLNIEELDLILPNLEQLIIEHVFMSERSLKYLLQNAPKLKMLQISGRYSSDVRSTSEGETETSDYYYYATEDEFRSGTPSEATIRTKNAFQRIFDGFKERNPNIFIRWQCIKKVKDQSYGRRINE